MQYVGALAAHAARAAAARDARAMVRASIGRAADATDQAMSAAARAADAAAIADRAMSANGPAMCAADAARDAHATEAAADADATGVAADATDVRHVSGRLAKAGPVAALLRPGRAGSNTAADDITVAP